MSFMRKLQTEPKLLENFKGGNGCVKMRPILNGDSEMYGKGRVFSYMQLDKGCEIGKHLHEGDGETFLILKGHGRYLLDGKLVDVGPGDVLFNDDGEEHYMINEADEPLEFIALVLYNN